MKIISLTSAVTYRQIKINVDAIIAMSPKDSSTIVRLTDGKELECRESFEIIRAKIQGAETI